jgi:hypothetical protein
VAKAEAVEVLRMAGWEPGRTVGSDVNTWERELASKGGFVMNGPARQFLIEFGGLAWPRRGAGEHLPSYSFNFDPCSAIYENDRFEEAEQYVGESLFPVGEVLNGHYFLALGESGTFYLVMDDVQPYASEKWDALERLLSMR